MPYFLTSDVQSEWLPETVLQKEGLERAIGRAERHVVSRYRLTRQDLRNTKRFFPQFASPGSRPVLLAGWREKADGTPDVDAMPEGLVEALRDTVARIVEYRMTAPDAHVESKSQGARSVSYSTRRMPRSVYAPLADYDERPAL